MNADIIAKGRYLFISLVCVGAVIAHTACVSPAISNIANLQLSKESLKRIVELAEQYIGPEIYRGDVSNENYVWVFQRLS